MARCRGWGPVGGSPAPRSRKPPVCFGVQNTTGTVRQRIQWKSESRDDRSNFERKERKLARMNWEKANKRDQVLKNGGERISAGKKLKAKEKTQSKKKGKKRQKRKSNAVPGCPATGGQHSFGPWIEYGFPHFGKIRICQVCNVKEAHKSGSRPSANEVPTLKELEHKLARLEGRPIAQDPKVKMIVSGKRSSMSEPVRRELSRQVPPTPTTFDFSIHQIHRVGGDRCWRCCCTWEGADTATRAKARGQHKNDWMTYGGDVRRQSDITAVKYLLGQYDQQHLESESTENS